MCFGEAQFAFTQFSSLDILELGGLVLRLRIILNLTCEILMTR